MKKILLIDDEEDILRVLSLSLRSDGYEVVTAGSGAEGLEVFERVEPEIVLTDIRMPGMDGLEVLRRIKARSPDTQVVIITGHGDIDSAIEALQFGASDFIPKPVRDQALRVALKRAEEKISTQRQLQAYTQDLEEMVRIATEEFERKSSFQAKLIRTSNDGIVATDDAWKIVLFNPGAERVFGHSRADVIRRRDARELYSDEIVAAIERDDPGDGRGELPWRETTIRSKSGEDIPVRFSGTLLREKHIMLGSVAFFQDLREIKRLERELVNSERLAAIGQTVAGMAHCIKNILHGFKGGGYLVNIGIDKNNTDKLQSGWQMIQRNIQRTSDLVLDLLSYSKEREPDYQKCTPNLVVDDVCELLRDNARDYGIELTKYLSTSIGEVMMDPRTVYRSVLNLVSNALEACMFDPEITKRHRVSVITEIEDGDVIRFEVRDNGAGMAPDVQKQLFSSFFSTKGSQGTGLGLLVTAKLIEEHEGTIDFASQPGKGTRFTIRLPFRRVEET